MNKEKEVEAYLKNELPEEEKLKYEIAQELGVLDKVLEGGWKSLSAKETGRIGGLVAGKRKENENYNKKTPLGTTSEQCFFCVTVHSVHSNFSVS